MLFEISVIIPSRDRKKYILDLLGDLACQTLVPKEIIVIDQSNEPYLLDRCKYIQDHDGLGPCHARNLAAAQAKGDILVFLDDDVRVGTNFLELLCEPIVQGEYIATCGAICDSDGNYESSIDQYWRSEHSMWITALTKNPKHSGNGISLSFSTGCSAVLRSVFDELKGFDTFFDPNGAGEDREFALRLFHAGYPIYYNGKAKVMHLESQAGGRRDLVNDIGVSTLDANVMYIIAKYFGWKVFNLSGWQWSYLELTRKLSANPLSWFRGIRRFFVSRSWIAKIRTLKKNNRWE